MDLAKTQIDRAAMQVRPLEPVVAAPPRDDNWSWIRGDLANLGAFFRRRRLLRAVIRMLENLLASVVRIQIHEPEEDSGSDRDLQALIAMLPEHARQAAANSIQGLLALARERFRFWWKTHASRVEALFRRIQLLQDRLADLNEKLEDWDEQIRAAAPPPPPAIDQRLVQAARIVRRAHEVERRSRQRALGYRLGALLVMSGEMVALWGIFGDIWGGSSLVAILSTMIWGAALVASAEALVSGEDPLLRRAGLAMLVMLSLVTGLLRACFLGGGSGWLVMLITQMGLVLAVPILALVAAFLLRNARGVLRKGEEGVEKLSLEVLERAQEAERLQAERVRAAREPGPEARKAALQAEQRQVLKEYQSSCADLEALIRQAESSIRAELEEFTRNVASTLADRIMSGSPRKGVL